MKMFGEAGESLRKKGQNALYFRSLPPAAAKEGGEEAGEEDALCSTT